MIKEQENIEQEYENVKKALDKSYTEVNKFQYENKQEFDKLDNKISVLEDQLNKRNEK